MLRTVFISVILFATLNGYSQLKIESRGGYFGFTLKKQNFQIAEELEAGFRTGRVINGNWTIIGFGVDAYINHVQDVYFDTASVYGGSAYLFTEPILFSKLPFFHISLPLTLGMGMQSYNAGEKNKLQDAGFYGIASAGIELDFHVLRNFTVSPGIYYKTKFYEQELEYDVESSKKPIIETTWHQPVYIGIALKIGGFGRKYN